MTHEAEARRVWVRAEDEDEACGVCTQGREPTLQGGVCPQAKLADSVATANQHNGMGTRTAESST